MHSECVITVSSIRHNQQEGSKSKYYFTADYRDKAAYTCLENTFKTYEKHIEKQLK